MPSEMGPWFGAHFGEDPTMMGAEEHPFLERGMRSHDVGTWQVLLGDVKVDDIFGPLTEASTKRFQARHGLKVDGKVGPHTWSAAYAKAAAPEPHAPSVKLKSAGSLLRQAEAELRQDAETVSGEKKKWGMPAVLALSALGLGALYMAFRETRAKYKRDAGIQKWFDAKPPI